MFKQYSTNFERVTLTVHTDMFEVFFQKYNQLYSNNLKTLQTKRLNKHNSASK